MEAIGRKLGGLPHRQWTHQRRGIVSGDILIGATRLTVTGQVDHGTTTYSGSIWWRNRGHVQATTVRGILITQALLATRMPLITKLSTDAMS